MKIQKFKGNKNRAVVVSCHLLCSATCDILLLASPHHSSFSPPPPHLPRPSKKTKCNWTVLVHECDVWAYWCGWWLWSGVHCLASPPHTCWLSFLECPSQPARSSPSVLVQHSITHALWLSFVEVIVNTNNIISQISHPSFHQACLWAALGSDSHRSWQWFHCACGWCFSQAMAVARLTPGGQQRPASVGNAVRTPPGSPGASGGQGSFLSPGEWRSSIPVCTEVWQCRTHICLVLIMWLSVLKWAWLSCKVFFEMEYPVDITTN